MENYYPSLTEEVAIEVGRSIIMSRLDYCNSLLAGITLAGLDRLQHNRQSSRPYRQAPTMARARLRSTRRVALAPYLRANNIQIGRLVFQFIFTFTFIFEKINTSNF